MKKLWIIALFFTVLTSGCSHYYYVANMQNVPLFKEKDEFHLSGAYAFGNESQCVEVQTAYSFTSNIGFMVDFMHASGGNPPTEDYGKGYYLDGAIGYFKPLGKNWVFEIYGGLGASNQHQVYTSQKWNDLAGKYYTVDEGTADLTFIKPFLQPSIGFTSGIFDIAVSTRFGNVKYSSINNNVFGNLTDYNEIDNISGTNHLFLEPALSLRAGWENIKLLGQVSYSYDANNPNLEIGEDWHFCLGISYVIANRFKDGGAK
jgi:hypothetical protein